MRLWCNIKNTITYLAPHINRRGPSLLRWVLQMRAKIQWTARREHLWKTDISSKVWSKSVFETAGGQDGKTMAREHRSKIGVGNNRLPGAGKFWPGQATFCTCLQDWAGNFLTENTSFEPFKYQPTLAKNFTAPMALAADGWYYNYGIENFLKCASIYQPSRAGKFGSGQATF